MCCAAAFDCCRNRTGPCVPTYVLCDIASRKVVEIEHKPAPEVGFVTLVIVVVRHGQGR